MLIKDAAITKGTEAYCTRRLRLRAVARHGKIDNKVPAYALINLPGLGSRARIAIHLPGPAAFSVSSGLFRASVVLKFSLTPSFVTFA
jgi:hypothetical protein